MIAVTKKNCAIGQSGKLTLIMKIITFLILASLNSFKKLQLEKFVKK